MFSMSDVSFTGDQSELLPVVDQRQQRYAVGRDFGHFQHQFRTFFYPVVAIILFRALMSLRVSEV